MKSLIRFMARKPNSGIEQMMVTLMGSLFGTFMFILVVKWKELMAYLF